MRKQKSGVVFSNDELAHVIMIASQVNPDDYPEDFYKSVIYKCRSLVERTGEKTYRVNPYEISL